MGLDHSLATSEYSQTGIIRTKAIELEKYKRFNLSNFAPRPIVSEFVGMIFLKKIFCETKIRVDPNAQIKPKILEMVMSNEQASITPMVRGRREM